MARSMALGVSVLALLVAFGASTLSQAQEQELPVSEVAPKIFVHVGEIALMTRENDGATANVGFIVGDNAVAVAIALAREGPRQFWFHFGDIGVGPPGARGQVGAIDNLITGERHIVEWGGVRLRIDPERDPALLFRCTPA